MGAKHRTPRRRRPRRRFRLIRSLAARLTESVGAVRRAIAEPRAVPLRIRDTYLRMWRSRGGGFYGLGYVAAFVALEVQAYLSSWQSASDDIAGLVMQEVLQFVFRFAAQSMLNGFLALGWPIFVVAKFGGAGLAVLAVAWWSFDRYARPWIAARLPEPTAAAQATRSEPVGDAAPNLSDVSRPAPEAPTQSDATGAAPSSPSDAAR